jgi:hypothetical protein
MKLLVVGYASIVLLIATTCDDGSGSSCERPGDEWCDGNVIVACLDARTDHYVRRSSVFETGVDCGDYSGTCVEWDDGESGLRVAGCTSSAGACDVQGDAVCESDGVIAYCEPPQQYVKYGCSEYHCVTNDSGQAVCAIEQGACIDGEEMCDPYHPPVYFRCLDGAWSDRHSCDTGGTCVQTTATEVDCDYPDASTIRQ